MKNSTIIMLYWGCFLLIAIPMWIFYSFEPVKMFFYFWVGLFVFAILLGWFLKKIKWQ